MNNYIIVTHIYPLFDYDIGHGLCLKVIKNPYHHEPGEPPEYKPLTGQIWPYSLALHGVDNVDWHELSKSFDVRDMVVFHSFITHNYMTYHYAENASRLDFDDDGLTFIADRGEISRTDTQVVDYADFPIVVGTRYTASPATEQIDYKKGVEVFSRLKEGKKSKELYDLVHLYEFARSFDQTHRVYKNANMGLSLFIVILEAIIGTPENCTREIRCDQCGRGIIHTAKSFEQHFRDQFGDRFKGARLIRHKTFHAGVFFDFGQYWSELMEKGIRFTEDDKWQLYMAKRDEMAEIIRIVLTSDFLERYSG